MNTGAMNKARACVRTAHRGGLCVNGVGSTATAPSNNLPQWNDNLNGRVGCVHAHGWGCA